MRTSLLMAQRYKKWLSPLTFTGTCDNKIFTTWLEHCLLRDLDVLNLKNQIIIIDNAPIHKNNNIRSLIERAGHTLLHLPSYSPDLNPIEQSFGLIKRRLQNENAESGVTLDDVLRGDLCVQD